MTVRFVARVELDAMKAHELYPREVDNEERVALLAGVVQLIQAALAQMGENAENRVHFMKSGTGVIGYAQTRNTVFFSEADDEREARDILNLVLDMRNAEESEIIKAIEESLNRPGSEIGSLWG
ncbi:MAG: hypothetical protein QXS20_01375 [Candidatus Thorarchaeota archaeon]